MRRKNAALTRDAILEAARIAFTFNSFDQVGVREITEAAGVNSSLVNRYFGTKDRLFAEVMRSNGGADFFADRTFDEVVALLADRALQKSTEGAAFDPVLALIRSAPVANAQPVLRDYLTNEAIAPLARLIGGDDADERASLAIAFLVGIIILRAILKSDPLASTKRNDLAALIEETVRSVTGEAAAIYPRPEMKKARLDAS